MSEIPFMAIPCVAVERGELLKKKLENMAIANALQLEAAGATPALFCFNYDTMQCLKSLNRSNCYIIAFCC